MQSYRPPISRDQYHDLEIYYHKLVSYTYGWEFRDMKSEKQAKIYSEINYISIALQIFGNIFSSEPDGKAVVAWKLETKNDEPPLLHSFSCIKVAAGVTGCEASEVSSVCKGKRPHADADSIRDPKTGRIIGKEFYKFVYADDYTEGEEILITK